MRQEARLPLRQQRGISWVMAKRALLPPIYVENRRVQFWFLEYERESDVARLGYELIAMPDNETRVPLGGKCYTLDEARPLVPPSLWELAQVHLADMRQTRDDPGEARGE